MHLDVLLHQPHKLLCRALRHRVDHNLDVRYADQQRGDHAGDARGLAGAPRGNCEEILVGSLPAPLSAHLLNKHSIIVSQGLHKRCTEHLVVKILLKAEPTLRKEQLNTTLNLLEKLIALCFLLPVDTVCVELSDQRCVLICPLNITPPGTVLDQINQATVEVLQG